MDVRPNPHSEPETVDRDDKDYRSSASTERYTIQSSDDEQVTQDVGSHTEAKRLSASNFLPSTYEKPNSSNNECSVNNREHPSISAYPLTQPHSSRQRTATSYSLAKRSFSTERRFRRFHSTVCHR